MKTIHERELHSTGPWNMKIVGFCLFIAIAICFFCKSLVFIFPGMYERARVERYISSSQHVFTNFFHQYFSVEKVNKFFIGSKKLFSLIFKIWINQNKHYVILGGKIRRFVIGKSWEHVVSPSINDTKLFSEPVTGGQKIRNFFHNCGVVLTSPSFTLLMLLLW